MSVMLFKLRGVEDDEAEEIRALLTEHEIDFYETTNGRWGLGFAAVWLHDDAQLAQASALIEAYQQQRYLQARETYQQLCLEGKQQTMWKTIKERPIQVLLVFLAVAFIGMFVLSPFLLL